MRTSLQTALSAGSMVSPARKIETPVILIKDYNHYTVSDGQNIVLRVFNSNYFVENEMQLTHPLSMETPAFIVLSLGGLHYMDLS